MQLQIDGALELKILVVRLKSVLSTAPIAASSAMRDAIYDLLASSLERTSG